MDVNYKNNGRSLLSDARKVTGMIDSNGVQAWELGHG
jgi:hypothetical protein